MSYSRRIKRGKDPYWIIARFNSICSCGKSITKGEDIFYYPNCRKAICSDCGRQGESDLSDEILNETMNVM